MAYCPCESPGASTVFHQQARGLSAHDDQRNPRDAMLEDLAEAIAQWQAAGDHIIAGMDANEDVLRRRLPRTAHHELSWEHPKSLLPIRFVPRYYLRRCYCYRQTYA
jgi:hypothetical protein